MNATSRKEGARATKRAPVERPPSLEWWKAPVEGWREGWIEIRSLLTGDSITVYLRTGTILARTLTRTNERNDFDD